MKNESKSSTPVVAAGFPFLPILSLIFVVAKLTDKIDWSWWWVLAPVWVPAAIALGIFLVAIVIMVIVAVAVAIEEEVKK